MKGIELPINILVIVAIAVIVLLGLVVLYFVGFNPFSSGISLTALKNQACGNFTLSYSCGSRGATTQSVLLSANSFGITTLFDLCCKKLGMTSATPPACTYTAAANTECAQLCGC
jgi:hypothetical protein